jgi:hypothetical protein
LGTPNKGTDDKSFPKSLKTQYYPVGIIAEKVKCKFNDPVILGKDDGSIVSLEATKIDGMTDFIIIETSHSMMRYNREVADQTIEFIFFKRPGEIFCLTQPTSSCCIHGQCRPIWNM